MSWSSQNRQSTTAANNHALPLAILGLIGVYAAYVLVGVLTNRAACGTLARPESIVAPLGFVATGATDGDEVVVPLGEEEATRRLRAWWASRTPAP